MCNTVQIKILSLGARDRFLGRKSQVSHSIEVNLYNPGAQAGIAHTLAKYKSWKKGRQLAVEW
jgi:hypothetical protein